MLRQGVDWSAAVNDVWEPYTTLGVEAAANVLFQIRRHLLRRHLRGQHARDDHRGQHLPRGRHHAHQPARHQPLRPDVRLHALLVRGDDRRPVEASRLLAARERGRVHRHHDRPARADGHRRRDRPLPRPLLGRARPVPQAGAVGRVIGRRALVQARADTEALEYVLGRTAPPRRGRSPPTLPDDVDQRKRSRFRPASPTG